MRTILAASLLILLAAVACGTETPEPVSTTEPSAMPEPTNATMPITPTPTTVDEVTNTPTPTATPEPTAMPTPTATSEPVLGSRENPVPLGVTIETKGEEIAEDHFEIMVIDVVPDATSMVLAENQFNDPPEAGSQFFMVTLRAKYLGPGSTTFDGGFRLRAVGTKGIVYTTFEDSCGVVPNELTDPELFTNGTIEGTACWQIASSDADSLIMFLDEHFLSFTGERVWFSLNDMSTPTSTLSPTSLTTWRGLVLAPEDRCSSYDPDDYPYSQSVEAQIVTDIGGIYGPYTGRWFASQKDTDIEHIVARSEAHDSGLCAANDAIRREFASDLLNLTLADPSVNRHQKSDKDAAEWLPDLNQCWFADRIVQVRLKYELTVDQAEADALGLVLTGCASVEMVVVSATESVTPTPTPTPGADVDALALWDDNDNGRITCAEARNHGIAPVHRGHPAYQYMRDADDDGIVCE